MTFINLHSESVSVTIGFFGDSGASLDLDFGDGPTHQFTFVIPGGTTKVFNNINVPPVETGGWAVAAASQPILGTIAFRFVQNGTPRVEVTSEPTLPTMEYTAVATPQAGLAIANPFNTSVSVLITVLDGNGSQLAAQHLVIPPGGHKSFNLFTLPGLPTNFTGALFVSPDVEGTKFLAWALYADSSGAISTLPEGRGGFPLSQPELIATTFTRVVAAFKRFDSLFGSTPQLVMSPTNSSNALNAYANSGSTVTINLALAELISDSPSELAFVIAHELGHIYQQRTGIRRWNFFDSEWDADMWGATISLFAEYDPYAAAGALGKLAMATGQANLGIQLWEDILSAPNAHGSFSTRIDNVSIFLQNICNASLNAQSACNRYKRVVHPHFPTLSTVPLLPAGDEPQVLIENVRSMMDAVLK